MKNARKDVSLEQRAKTLLKLQKLSRNRKATVQDLLFAPLLPLAKHIQITPSLWKHEFIKRCVCVSFCVRV